MTMEALYLFGMQKTIVGYFEGGKAFDVLALTSSLMDERIQNLKEGQLCCCCDGVEGDGDDEDSDDYQVVADEMGCLHCHLRLSHEELGDVMQLLQLQMQALYLPDVALRRIQQVHKMGDGLLA